INRRRRVKLLFQGCARGVGVTGQALFVRLRSLVGHSYQHASEIKICGIESPLRFQESALHFVGWLSFAALGDRVPGVAVIFLLAWIGGDDPAQFSLSTLLCGDEFWIFQSIFLTANCFQAVFYTEQVFVRATILLGTPRSVLREHRMLP